MLSTASTAYLHTGMQCGYTYYYRIAAYNGSSESSLSSTVSIPGPSCGLDLTVSSLSGYNPVGRGIVYWPTVTINRTGASLTNGTYVLVRVYLSTDATITPADYQCSFDADTTSQFSNSTLNANGTLSQGVLCEIPPGMPTGWYYWGAIVDPPGYHAESNESNNSKQGSMVQVQ
jgi:hypothetical protein